MTNEDGITCFQCLTCKQTPRKPPGALVQEVTAVTHRDSVEDLVRKGRDLETVVLARAARAHLEHKTLVFGNKTVVFD